MCRTLGQAAEDRDARWITLLQVQIRKDVHLQTYGQDRQVTERTLGVDLPDAGIGPGGIEGCGEKERLTAQAG